MPASSYLQTSMLGGKWSPYAQGRADQETYRTALNECLNAYPVPTGAAVRRQGTLFGATTRNGVAAVVRTFDFTQNQPFTLEFTAGHLRLWNGLNLVLTNQHTVSSISSANPAVVGTAVAHGYSTNDQVEFQATFLTPGQSPAGLKPLLNRQFSITKVDNFSFSLHDPVTGAGIDGSTIVPAGWSITVAKIVDYAVPYQLADLENIRVVQSEDTALILCPGFQPYQIVNLNSLTGLGVNQITVPTAVTFLDGPYLDPPTDGTTLTPSGVSGSITLTASSITNINNGAGFVSTDVGRLVRLFAQPAQWATGTTYSKGQNVTFNNAYYQSLVGGNVGNEPDTDTGTHWAVATAAAAWTWAIITAINSTSEVTATVQAADPLGVLAGGPLLNSLALTVWQLGVYSNTTTWPTGGTFHEGRFWLFSEVKNRADASMGNNNGTPVQQGLNFAPTALDGTVGDNNGIAAVLEGTSINSIFWMVSTETGIVVGTQAGEWNIVASALDDPITPTSIQAKRKTRYGCANVEPVVAPLATLFVQRYQRHLYEYICDAYSRKWTGTNVAEKAQDIILPGIAEIALVQEPVPIVWARTFDNRLIGMSYKRESPFGTQPASFFGWHHHALGSGREIVSMRGGPAALGSTDNISIVTLDPSTGIYFVEFLSPYFDEGSTLLEADFVDAAVTPTSAVVSGSNIIFYGLSYIAGKTVTAWVGGVDGGDFVVAADGSLTVPFNVADGLLTSAYLQSLNGGDFALNIQVTPPSTGFAGPLSAGTIYTMANNYNAHLSTNAALSCFDWDNNIAYLRATTNTTQHVEALALSNEAQLWDQSLTGDEYGSANGATLGPDGNIYYGTSTSATLVNRFNVTTKATDIAYDDLHSLQARSAFISAFTGVDGNIYTASVSINSGNTGGNESSFIDIVQFAGGAATYVNSVQPAELVTGGIAPSNVTLTRRGPQGSIFAFAMASSGASLGFYRVVAENVTAAGLGLITVLTPSQIQAGWTSFTLTEPIYDETDGNVLYFTTGSDATSRLIKLNATTGAIMWKLTISGFYDMHTSRCRYGRLQVLGASAGGGNFDVYEVNTLAGTATHTTESAIGNAGGGNNSTDDLYGQMVVKINDTTASQWETFGRAPSSGPANIIPALVYSAPTLIGFTYEWQVQLLRAVAPQETQTVQGPALGKTRRIQQIAAIMANSQGVSIGTDLTQDISPLRPMNFEQPNQTPYTLLQLFTGVYWDLIEDDNSFDGMVAFQGTRPYPAAIVAVEAFLHTQDRN